MNVSARGPAHDACHGDRDPPQQPARRAIRRSSQLGERAEAAFAGPHPFAEFLRTIGRGTVEDHAHGPLGLAAEPVQLGAFLLVLRYRTETPAELGGFVRAARSRLAGADGIAVDLDWPSYADRRQQLPYFLLAALLLAGSGMRG